MTQSLRISNRMQSRGLTYALALCGFMLALAAQAQISGVINTYSRVRTITTNVLTVDNVSGAGTGAAFATLTGQCLLIQMKGATLDVSNPTNGANFGFVTAYNQAGLWEFVTVSSAVDLGGGQWQITLTGSPVNSYAAGTPGGSVQLIHVPHYGDISVTGTLTGTAWNATTGTGGVVAFTSNGIVTVNANISADALGFAGGLINVNNGTVAGIDAGGCHRSTPFGSTNAALSGKGESIAPFDALYPNGRGRWASGGGGGMPHNSGGGGGGNFSRGGIGGDAWDGQAACDTLRPNGLPGLALDYSTGRIFLGGGGGGGHENNGNATPGGRGGGIVIVRARILTATGLRTISANGQAIALSDGNDSGGGGGAGGSIYIDALDYNLPAPCGTNAITVTANGGNGTTPNTDGSVGLHGGGGGGGAGYIAFGPSSTPSGCITFAATPGASGLSCTGGGACTTGGLGTAGGPPSSTTTGPVTPPGNPTPLPIVLVSFSALRAGSDVELRWLVASELNNSHFALERSVAGQPFAFVGTVMGRGTSSTPHTYAYRDIEVPSGSLRYRLRQIDFDGTETIYGPVVVSAAEGAPELTLLRNPARSGEPVLVQLSGARPGQRLELVDLAGRVLAYHLMSGDGLVLLRAHDLSPGVYLVRLQGTKLSQRLLVE